MLKREPQARGALPALPRLRWAAGWIGCCTVAAQGPTLLLLARDASVDPRLLVVTLLATPAAAWLGLSALRRTSRALNPADRALAPRPQ